MACGTMQLRFFKLGTVLTYAFKYSSILYNYIFSYFPLHISKADELTLIASSSVWTSSSSRNASSSWSSTFGTWVFRRLFPLATCGSISSSDASLDSYKRDHKIWPITSTYNIQYFGKIRARKGRENRIEVHGGKHTKWLRNHLLYLKRRSEMALHQADTDKNIFVSALRNSPCRYAA